MPKQNDENVDSRGYITARWLLAILIAITLSLIGAWGAERGYVERRLDDRIVVLEKNHAMVLERLESNGRTLNMIYDELKQHRTTGK